MRSIALVAFALCAAAASPVAPVANGHDQLQPTDISNTEQLERLDDHMLTKNDINQKPTDLFEPLKERLEKAKETAIDPFSSVRALLDKTRNSVTTFKNASVANLMDQNLANQAIAQMTALEEMRQEAEKTYCRIYGGLVCDKACGCDHDGTDSVTKLTTHAEAYLRQQMLQAEAARPKQSPNRMSHQHTPTRHLTVGPMGRVTADEVGYPPLSPALAAKSTALALADASDVKDVSDQKVIDATGGKYKSCKHVSDQGLCSNELAKEFCRVSCADSIVTALTRSLPKEAHVGALKHTHVPVHAHIPAHVHIPIAHAVTQAVNFVGEKVINPISGAVESAVDVLVMAVESGVAFVANGVNEAVSTAFEAVDRAVTTLAEKGGQLGKMLYRGAQLIATNVVAAATAVAEMAAEIAAHIADYASMIATFFRNLFKGCNIKFMDFVNAFRQPSKDGIAGWQKIATMGSEAKNIKDGALTVATAACNTAWSVFNSPKINLIMAIVSTLASKCPALGDGFDPAISIGVTLTASAAAGNVVEAGAELGLAIDKFNNRYCYVGGCLGSGGSFPPETSVGGDVGIAVTLWDMPGRIPGEINFGSFGLSIEIPIPPPFPGGKIEFDLAVNWFWNPGDAMHNLKGGGVAFDIGPEGEPPDFPISISVTSGTCYTPVCINRVDGSTCGDAGGASPLDAAPGDSNALDSSNTWKKWDGLKQDITTGTGGGHVLAWFQTAHTGANTHVLSRLYIEGSEQRQTRFISGDTAYASTAGFFVGYWHGQSSPTTREYQVYYRTPGGGISCCGSDWQSRSLMVLPMTLTHWARVVPTDSITLSSSNVWHDWPGLNTHIYSHNTNSLIIAMYQTATEAKNSHILSKMYVDNVEKPQTRSIAGDTVYGSNIGVYIGSAGKTGYINLKVKYRTPAGGITCCGGDWQTRALSAIAVAPSTVYVLNPTNHITLSSSNEWHQWPGLYKQFYNYNAGDFCIAWYQTSTQAMNNHLLSKMYVDGVEQKQTRSIVGNTVYATTFGFFAQPMSVGYHTIAVKYKTPGVGITCCGGDWDTRALSIAIVPKSSMGSSPTEMMRALQANENATADADDDPDDDSLVASLTLQREAGEHGIKAGGIKAVQFPANTLDHVVSTAEAVDPIPNATVDDIERNMFEMGEACHHNATLHHRLQGLFAATGRVMNGAPIWSKLYYNHTYFLYKRANNRWIVDFDQPSEEWQGTVAYSEPTHDIQPASATWAHPRSCTMNMITQERGLRTLVMATGHLEPHFEPDASKWERDWAELRGAVVHEASLPYVAL